MPEISTAQKYARIFGMPEEDIANADYDIFTNILTVTYGIDKPRYKQKKVTQRASKEFADFFKAPIFVGKSVDYILTAYLKAKGMNPVVREGQRPAKVYYTSTEPVFGKMTLRQFIETEVKERGNYTLADVQSWMRRYNISENDLAIWVSPKKWVANRYNLLAEEWDKAKFVPESEMSVYEIKGDEGFIVPESDDGDEGYLFVFKRDLNPVVREAVNHVTDQHERANKIIEEIKASGLSPKEKRKKIGEGLKALADGIDRSVYTAIRDFRPLGIMSEMGMLMGAQPRKGVRIDTPFGAYVFDNKRVPSKEMVDSWYAQHKEAETINTLAVEYAFGLEAIPNTVTGNFRVVEHARRLRAQGLLSPEEEHVLNALEKYWQEHPEFDRQKGYGIWGYNLEIMVPESLRKNMIEKKGSLIDAILKSGPGEVIPIEYKDVPLGKRILLPSNITGSEIQRRGDLIVVAVHVDRDIVAYLYVQKGSRLIQICPIPWQKMQIKPGELVNTPEYNGWVERIKKEAPEYLPEWEKIAIKGTEAIQKPEVLPETTPAGIRAGDTIIHKTAKYTAVVDKVYKNGNADITVVEAKGIPEWEKSIKEGFPIKIHVKDLDRYFEKVSPRLAEEQKPVIKGTEAKQPWEMTYREFANFFEEVWSGQRFSFAERVGKPLGIQSQAGEPYHMIKGRRIGYSGGLSRDRWRLAIVDKALSEGKKVPEEVLAELSEALKEEKEKLGGAGMAEPQEGAQKEPWEMTKEEYWRAGAGGKAFEGRGTSDYNHMLIVGEAFSKGKPIPTKVLRDYPKLAESYPVNKTWRMNRSEALNFLGSTNMDLHRRAIKEALEVGLTPYAGWEKDYPELLSTEKTKLPRGKEMVEPSQEETENRFRALLKEAKEKGFIEQEKEWIDRFNDPTRSKENTILDLEGLIKTMEKRTPPAAVAVGSPYEVKATVSFIARERVWSTVLQDSTGYPHGAQNYHLLKEALNALETGELEQDFDRESARRFYIRQMGLDPENPDDLKQIMAEYSEGHDPRRGIKITDILYSDEVKAQKVLVLEHQFTSRELDALNIEDLKKIALVKGAKTTGKKEEVAAAILQLQGVEKPEEEKKVYRYYYSHRPPGIGTQPEGFINHETWLPIRTTAHGRTAFGWVEYDRPLTPEEISGYELFVDEAELPKLVKEIVQFAHDEGIDEAMRVIDTEYGRAVWDWLKSQKRIRAGVGQKEQIRAEIVRLAGITEKEKPVEAQPAAKPKIEPKVTDTQAIYKKAKEVAEWWFNSQMKNPFTEFYLYHKAGDFRVAIETPEGYKLSDAQRISPAWTKEQAEQWIYEKVQRLPILPLMPVAPLPLYSPRAEPTYKELIRTQQVREWTVKYKFEWKSAMGYYSGFIWVNRGIGEGIRTAIINITSPEEIPKEVEKAIAEAEKVTQKPILESAELLYKRYTSGYSYVSLLGIVRQDLKDLAHSIGYELKLDTAIYTPEVLLQYAEKFKEYAQRDYDIEHKKHEARKETEQAEKEKEKREGGEAFWNEVKDLKVIDFEVQHDVNPDRPTRTYFHVYDRTIATLENGKRVQISYVINKGEYGKRALKATKEYYMTMYGQYMGKPLSNWITYDQLMIGNRYEEYLAQKPIRIEVLERFPTKSFLEPKIRDYGKWIRENTYGEAGVRRLQTGSYEEVIATIKEFIRKYYNLAPAPADYIFRRPAYQQTEIGVDSLATSFFNVAANGWDLANTFKEWEAGETRQEWDRRLEKELKPAIKLIEKPEERILGELRTKYRFSRPEGDMVAKAIDSYIKMRDKPIVYSILSPVRDGKFIAEDLIAMVEGTYWLKKEAPVPVPLALPAAKVQSIQEIKQQAVQSIQQAKTADELKQILKGIGFLPLPDADKRQVMDLYQNKYSILASEKPFGERVPVEEKPIVIGAPTKQELAEAEMRRKAEEGKKLRGQVELGGAVTTAARLGLFEPGAMEKAKAEAEARRRIEQLGLPYEIHPYIKKLAESREYLLKFGAVAGKETLEDIILSRYKPYCPPGTIVDNKGAKGQRDRWWVYPERLRACMTEVQQKIAAAAVPAGVAMVKEAVNVLSPSLRQYIQGAQAVRDVIHYFMDRRPSIRGVLYRAGDGTYFVEAQDGQRYASMGWVDVDGWAILEQASLRAGVSD